MEELIQLAVKNFAPALLFFISAWLYWQGSKLKGKTASKDMLYNQIEAVMIQAENLKITGVDKKDFVVSVIKKYVETHKLGIDENTISNIIESFMSVANSINRRETNIPLENENKQLKQMLVKEQELNSELRKRG